MAITNVYFQPKIWSSGYNPIVWSVGSDKATQTDMKFVFDVFVNAATGATVSTYRIKQRPNPAGAGMIDVSTLVQPYLQLTNYNPELVATQYSQSPISFASMHVKVGEEYLSNGAQTIFNGYGATGAPGYFLSPYGATGSFVRTIPSALTFNEQMGIMNATTTYNPFWSTYIMDGNGKYLSLEPGNRSVRLTDRHTLSFLNRWDALPTYGSFASSILGIRVTTYTSTGAVLGSNNYDNTTTNGGGPQTNSIYTSTTESRQTDLLSFRCGPIDLNLTSSSMAYYTVTAFMKLAATSDPTYTYVASEVVRFDIDRECEDLYKNVRLSWLNSLGGRDYYNFKMFYEKTTTSTQEVYNQFPLNWSASSPVVASTTENNYNRGGDKIFSKSVNTNFQIQSDWLTQDYVDYLAGIPESSSVWAYIGDDSSIPYTVVIENVDYTYKNVMQTKLVQATFTCRYTKNQVKQNL